MYYATGGDLFKIGLAMAVGMGLLQVVNSYRHYGQDARLNSLEYKAKELYRHTHTIIPSGMSPPAIKEGDQLRYLSGAWF